MPGTLYSVKLHEKKIIIYIEIGKILYPKIHKDILINIEHT